MGKPHFTKLAPTQIKQKIDMFFDMCDLDGEPYTITGICLELGTTRKTFWKYVEEYKDDYPEIAEIFGNAATRVEHELEKQVVTRESKMAGVIFALKNHGWTDKEKSGLPWGEAARGSAKVEWDIRVMGDDNKELVEFPKEN